MRESKLGREREGGREREAHTHWQREAHIHWHTHADREGESQTFTALSNYYE